MRDPARIDVVLARLRAFWLAHPDLRLGQIVVNAVGRGTGYASNVFSAEDEEFTRGLDALEKRITDAAVSGGEASGG